MMSQLIGSPVLQTRRLAETSPIFYNPAALPSQRTAGTVGTVGAVGAVGTVGTVGTARWDAMRAPLVRGTSGSHWRKNRLGPAWLGLPLNPFSGLGNTDLGANVCCVC